MAGRAKGKGKSKPRPCGSKNTKSKLTQMGENCFELVTIYKGKFYFKRWHEDAQIWEYASSYVPVS